MDAGAVTFERRSTRRIQVGSVPVGDGAPISIQSMTTTKTADVDGTLAQIYSLDMAGVDIVRCTCNEKEAAEGLARIVPRSPVPIIADIHHQYRMALAAMEAGVHGLRLNPGNIRKPAHIKAVASEARDRGIPIRIGVNGGSLDPALYEKYGGRVTPEAMVESAMTEIAYFDRLKPAEKKSVAVSLMSQNVPCFIVTRDLTPDKKLLEACEKNCIPLFSTKLYTGKLISMLQEILEVRLAPFATAHGVLMDIHRLGVLLLGKSGIGKSECALDLILRGSKLISDDIVEIRKVGPTRLVGNGPERIKHLMEIRGVGIINIKDLFGTTSVMERREIDMVIELVQWNPDTEYDRLGIETGTYNILGIDLPHLVIPVSPGRNTSTIIEVAARNQLLKQSGGRPVQLFDN